MQIHKNSQLIIEKFFPYLGANKKQELIRLVYELAKRDSIPPVTVLRHYAPRHCGEPAFQYPAAKQSLLKHRYPYAYFHNELTRPYLPKLKLSPASITDIKPKPFYPKKIFIEKPARLSALALRFRKSFPKAETKEIPSLKGYLMDPLFRGNGPAIKNYNNRRDTVFITYQNYDFFKKCPCTKNSLRCFYHIFNLSFGCIYDCTYCYIQEYANAPGIIFPANIDKFFKAFPSYKKPGMRIGTGEFSDSLMLDNITEYSLSLVDFFKKYQDVLFEFKTKSANIENLLKAKHSGNIAAAWSLNPQKIIDENEYFTASLKDRLSSAKKCAQAGYKIAIHFDPVIYFEGWEKEYEKVVDMLFKSIKPKDTAWISIGTLRFNPKVKQTIEARFPKNKIMDAELLPGFDKKLRYPQSLRQKIYTTIIETLSKHSKKLRVYLCMENYTGTGLILKKGAV